MAQRPRIVIALTDAAERGAVAQWLVEEGFDCVCRPTSSAAAEELQSRPFDLLITDAAFAFGELQRIGRGCRKPAAPVVIVGDALADNPERAAGGWRSFVDTVPVAERPHTDAIKAQ